MPSSARSGGLAALLLAIVLLLLQPSPSSSQALPEVTADRSKLVGKLVSHEFQSLDSELSSYEQQAETDPRSEMNAMVAFRAFDTSQHLISTRVDDWARTSPNSYAAALARAICRMSMGWRWRGTDWSNDFSNKNWGGTEEYLREAGDEAKRALAFNPNLGLAYAVRIEAARSEGSRAELKRIEGEALARMPESFAVREQVIYALRPGWGGSRQAMQEFADSSQSYAYKNPAMRFLKAWVALDTGDELAARSRWPEALDYYTRALQLGGEYWMTYRRRAKAFYAMGRWSEATADAVRANQLFPQHSETLKLLAYATAQQHKPEASILWTALYVKFEIADPSLAEITKLNAKELKFDAVLAPSAPISQEQRRETLRNIESSMPSDPAQRHFRLSDAAIAAFNAGELDKAESYANEALSAASQYPTDWEFGNAIFYGNMVNGLVALRRDNNISLAEGYLLASGRTPGSPQLGSFGPDMTLAKELLALGERHTVVDFLADCRHFWKAGQDKLDNWTDTIEEGGTPDFAGYARHFSNP